MPTALEGLRVLEFGWGMPVALAGMVLADNGAEVTKVEPPGGDPTRGRPAFVVWHRGKKSVVLDLKQPVDQERARALAATADVVLENFRPGVAERLGVGYAALSADNPGLIYCAITAFGPDGPYARYKGYDQIIGAKVGIMQEFATMSPHGGPAYTAIPMASFGAAQAALHGTLSALHSRNQTGRGQRVETSLVQGLTAYDYFDWLMWQLVKKYPDAFMLSAPVSKTGTPQLVHFLALLTAYTRDGRWLQFNNLTPDQFRAFLRAIDMEQDYEAARTKKGFDFEDEAEREHFWDKFLARMREKTLAEWDAIFMPDPNIGFEALRTTAETLEHPQLRHNRQVAEVHDPVLGKTVQVGPLVHMSATPPEIGAPAPALGQHQDLVRSAECGVRSSPPLPGVLPGEGRGTPHSDPLSQVPRRTPHSEPPLAGLTILELANYYAAPFGTAALADLGARIIKVEPFAGDLMRAFLPLPEAGGVKTLQGKESVAVDLKTAEGRKFLDQLLAKADMLMHNFRPGVAERLGLDYATVHRSNPRLIYLYATGYGPDGPYALRPIYALTAAIVAGNPTRQMGRLAPPPGTPLDPAQLKKMSVAFRFANRGDGDPTSALAVATGLLLGLLARDRTGEGQYLMTSMIGSNAYINADESVQYLGRPEPPQSDAALLGLNALHRQYQAQDGWVFLAAPRAEEWRALCRALGRGDWAEDHCFATAEARRAHDTELASALATIFAERPATAWERELTERGVACVAVYDANFASFANTDPVFRDGFMVEVEHPVFGKHLRHGPMVMFSESANCLGVGCQVGQHTAAILRELGYAEDAIERLRELGAVSWPG
jgi:crotonobetainyl-CoA:carnitine CoA-transferase CaiB-like acyl-CoA transferase